MNGYKFESNDRMRIGLHDCRSDRMRHENGVFTMVFPEGFYDLAETAPEPERTGCGEMACRLPDEDFDGVTVYVFTETAQGVLREDRSDDFCEAVNRGDFVFECVTTLYGYQRLLLRGYIWFDAAPYHRECEIELHTDLVTFRWSTPAK